MAQYTQEAVETKPAREILTRAERTVTAATQPERIDAEPMPETRRKNEIPAPVRETAEMPLPLPQEQESISHREYTAGDISDANEPTPMFDVYDALQELSIAFPLPAETAHKESEAFVVTFPEWPEEFSLEFVQDFFEYTEAGEAEIELGGQIVQHFEALESEELEASYELVHDMYETAGLLLTLHPDLDVPLAEYDVIATEEEIFAAQERQEKVEELVELLTSQARELLVALHLPADEKTVELLVRMTLASMRTRQAAPAAPANFELNGEINREFQLPTLDSSDDFISHAMRREKVYLSALGRRIITLHTATAPAYA